VTDDRPDALCPRFTNVLGTEQESSVEKRSVAPLALLVGGAAVLGAVVFLVIQVKAGATPPELDPDELLRAPPARTAPAAAPVLPSAARAAAGRGRIGLSRPPAGDEREAPIEPLAPAPTRTAQAQDTRTEAAITEAIEYYDRGEYESARSMALEALARLADSDPPMTDRMLRIAASSSCYIGDAEQARALHAQLTPKSQIDVDKRCRRVGVQLR
jgi:hypothetical protein